MILDGIFKNKKESEWKSITKVEELDSIEAASFTKPQLIFKHSIRCSISSMAKNRLEAGMAQLKLLAEVYYLDLLSYRSVSNEIETRFNIPHESPQVIILKNGKVVYDVSHNGINVEEIIKELN